MSGELYDERNEALTESPLNTTFGHLVHMPETEFRTWAKSLRDEVAKIWKEQGSPPIFGFTTDEIVSQFAALSRKEVSNVLVTDELTGRIDCLLPDSTLGPACRAFFSNMAKTKDLGDSGEGYSLWQYFTEPGLFDVFLKKMRRHFKRDGFYAFSRPITQSSFWQEIFRREPLIKLNASDPIPDSYYSLSDHATAMLTISKPDGLYTLSRPVPEVSSGRECIEFWRNWKGDGLDYGWDFWLEAKSNEPSANRATEERPLMISKGELEELRKRRILPQRYVKDIEVIAKDPKNSARAHLLV